MAFVNPIDAATPTGAESAATGDNRIRELKAALNERMPEIMDGWPDGPLVLKNFHILYGTHAARPNPPAALNQLYISTDTGHFAVSVDGDPDEWLTIYEPPAAEEAATAFAIKAVRAIALPLAMAYGAEEFVAWDGVAVAPAGAWTGIDPTKITIPAGTGNTKVKVSTTLTILMAAGAYEYFNMVAALVRTRGTVDTIIGAFQFLVDTHQSSPDAGRSISFDSIDEAQDGDVYRVAIMSNESAVASTTYYSLQAAKDLTALGISSTVAVNWLSVIQA